MIRCSKKSPVYPIATSFVFSLLERIATGEYRAASRMIDNGEDYLFGRLELALSDGGEFPSVEEIDYFGIHFFPRGLHRGYDYSVEFYIPCSNMTMHTKIELERVRGGFRVHLINC